MKQKIKLSPYLIHSVHKGIIHTKFMELDPLDVEMYKNGTIALFDYLPDEDRRYIKNIFVTSEHTEFEFASSFRERRHKAILAKARITTG